MKRILLSLVLICASFACNAMDDGRERFEAIPHNVYITPKQVDEALTNNRWIEENKEAFLQVAIARQSEPGVVNFLDSPSIFSTFYHANMPAERIPGAKHDMAILKIMEYAHNHCKDCPNYSELRSQEVVQELLSKFNELSLPEDSDSIISSIYSKKAALALTTLIAGLIVYYSYSKSTHTKKAN